MKLFKRIGIAALLAVCAVCAVAWVGSAWAADIYDVRVKPTLDSTGTHLTLEFTFYENGQKQNDTFASILDDKAVFEQHIGVKINIKTSENTEGWDFISDRTEYYADRVIADYTFSEAPDPDIDYLFSYQSLWGNDENPMPAELKEEMEGKYGGWMDVHDRYEGVAVNGGQPVHLERPSSNSEPYTIIVHRSAVPLTAQGKPDYDSAEFSSIEFSLEFNPGLDNAPEYGGEFNIDGLEQWELVDREGNVYDRNHGEISGFWYLVSDGADYTEYTAAFVDDNDKWGYASFRGISQNRKDGVPNKRFDWEFDSYSGSGTVYDFHTTEQQIEDGTAPYVEVTDSALQYKITAPFAGRARFDIRGGIDGAVRLHRTDWFNFSGSALEDSIDFAGKNFTKADITRIQVDLRPSAADLPDGSQQRYRWVFSLPRGADADAGSVAEIIQDYGLTAEVSGNTVTVTGNVNKLASDVLYLGDISGLLIDWKADLTVTGGYRPSKGVGMINFSNGEFKLTGGTIQLPTRNDGWVDAIDGNGQPTVRLAGGTVKGDGAANAGIIVESGTLIIDSGKIDIPRGNAIFAKKLIVNDSSTINGLAATMQDGGSSIEVRAYGHTIIITDTDITYSDDSDDDDFPSSITYVAGNGATLDFDAIISDSRNSPLTTTLRVETGGTVNLKNKTFFAFKGSLIVEKGAVLNTDEDSTLIVAGTITINGAGGSSGANVFAAADPSNGVLDNSGALTIPANGKLVNNGIIKNADTGTITNEGTIDNTNGTIDNKGVIKSDPANYSGKAPIGEPVESENGGGSGGGGCNAGLGLSGLLLAILAVGRSRKA